MDQIEAHVRHIWDLYEKGDVEGYLAGFAPDAVLVPLAAGGREIHGHEQLRAYMAEQREERVVVQAVAHRFEVDGDQVTVRGSIRVRTPRAMSERRTAWRFTVRDGLVVRAEALAA